MRTLSSRDNPLIRQIRGLVQSSHERRKSGRTLLDGPHLIDCWLSAYGDPLHLLVSSAATNSKEIAALIARTSSSRVIEVTPEVFDSLKLVEAPTGILAVIEPPVPIAPPSLKHDAILLDRIQDPGNLGSILRSARAAGFKQALLSSGCAQAWSPRVLRAGMGAHFGLQIYESADLQGFLSVFGGKKLVAEASGASIFESNIGDCVAWTFGSEGDGVGANLCAISQSMGIPLVDGSESLNVAAAAAICLFETVRQRR